MTTKYSHYFKDVRHLTHIDVYRVLDLYDVQRGSVAHAVKKLLCAGGRGAKKYMQDIIEARDSLNRELQMLDEDGSGSHWINHTDTPPTEPLIASETPGLFYKVSAGEFSREQLHAAGWTDESIKKHGVKVKSEPSIPLPVPPTSAYDTYHEVSKSQPMLALYAAVRKLVSPEFVQCDESVFFNYLFTSLKLHKEKGSTVAFLETAFREHFGIETTGTYIFEDFLEITQHTKFDFDAFDDKGNLKPTVPQPQ